MRRSVCTRMGCVLLPRPSAVPTAVTPNMPFSSTRLSQHTRTPGSPASHAWPTSRVRWKSDYPDYPHATVGKRGNGASRSKLRRTAAVAGGGPWIAPWVSAQRVRRSADAGDRVRAPGRLLDDARGRAALADRQCRGSCLLERSTG